MRSEIGVAADAASFCLLAFILHEMTPTGKDDHLDRFIRSEPPSGQLEFAFMPGGIEDTDHVAAFMCAQHGI